MRPRSDENRSGAQARDRLKEKFGKQQAEQMEKLLLAAWSSPKWKEASKLALQIRDNPDLTNEQKGYLQAKAIEWAASP